MADEQIPEPLVSYEDFAKLDLRIAKVLEVKDHPNADKLLCMTIDIGGGQQRQIIAGLKGYYSPQQLLGKDIVVVVNLQPRKMRGLESQGMLLAASQMEGEQRLAVVFLQPERPLPAGSPVS